MTRFQSNLIKFHKIVWVRLGMKISHFCKLNFEKHVGLEKISEFNFIIFKNLIKQQKIILPFSKLCTKDHKHL